MISAIAKTFPAAQSSPQVSKASSKEHDSSDVINVYMLDEKCIYSGGGHNGQSVNVVYTDDSTAEDPIVKIFGNATSGNYEEVVHIKDIDPTNATYSELCALLAHQHRIGAYTPGANKLLMPTPVTVDPGSYTERKDYMSLIRDSVRDSDYFGITNSSKELLEFFEQYLNERSEKEEKFSMPSQIDYVGHFRVDTCR